MQWLTQWWESLRWTLDRSVSTYGPEIDWMYYAVLAITGTIFLGVEASLIYFLFRYRHRAGRRAEFRHGNVTAEVVWTAAPFFIVLWIGFASRSVWKKVKDPHQFPAAGLELAVTARQFEWNVTYPGLDGRLGTDDDFTKRNQLHVPAGTPVLVHLASEDVIHSFFLPDFRLKQDAVPGMEIKVWFEATDTGEFTLACAELCGLGHYRMRASVTVHAAEDFRAWQQGEALAAAAQATTTAAATPVAGAAPAASSSVTQEP